VVLSGAGSACAGFRLRRIPRAYPSSPSSSSISFSLSSTTITPAISSGVSGILSGGSGGCSFSRAPEGRGTARAISSAAWASRSGASRQAFKDLHQLTLTLSPLGLAFVDDFLVVGAFFAGALAAPTLAFFMNVLLYALTAVCPCSSAPALRQ
jgi:hypothetical protein